MISNRKHLPLWRMAFILVTYVAYYFSLGDTPMGIAAYICFFIAFIYAALLMYFSLGLDRSGSATRWTFLMVDLVLIGAAVNLFNDHYFFFLYFLPIIAAADKGGTRDALIVAVAAGAVHIAYKVPHTTVGEIMQVLSFLIVALFTGLLLEKRFFSLRSDYEIDSLTNLPTRRSFLNLARAAIAKGSLQEFAVLTLDIDDFCAFNENYGYNRGNQVLEAVATVIVEQIRSKDLAARYGGEKFAVFLPDTDKAGALQSADRLRDAIESLINFDEPIKVSIGIAGTPEDADDLEGLMGSAQNRMYRAKDLGGNRVVSSLAE